MPGARRLLARLERAVRRHRRCITPHGHSVDCVRPSDHYPLIQPCWRATEWKAIHKLQFLELIVAFLFLAQLLLLVSLGNDMLIPMYIPYISWPPPGSVTHVFSAHEYHVGNFLVMGAIATFFAISFVGTALPVTILWQRFAGGLLYEFVQYAHYFEWCFTASDMALIIAVLNGVTDVSFLCGGGTGAAGRVRPAPIGGSRSRALPARARNARARATASV